jgi:hypothetical protein
MARPWLDKPPVSVPSRRSDVPAPLSRKCQVSRRVILELPVRAQVVPGGLELPGLSIQYQQDSVFGSANKSPGILIKLAIAPNPVDLPGMAEFAEITRLVRYWDAAEIVVEWGPNNIEHDGEIMAVFVAPEEGAALTDYGYLRGVADVRTGAIGQPFVMQLEATSMQLFAKTSPCPDGLHWGIGSLTPARRAQLQDTSALACATLVVALANYGQIYKVEDDYAVGTLRVSVDVRGYETAVAPPLPFPIAALFPGWTGTDSDVQGATRLGTSLLARGEAVASLSQLAEFIASRRHPFMNRAPSPWLQKRFFRNTHFLGLWPQILGFAAQLGADIVKKFTAPGALRAPLEGCVKWLHLDLRDETSCTEFPEDIIKNTPTELRDSHDRLITDAAVSITNNGRWDRLRVDRGAAFDDADSLSLLARPLQPGYGPSLRTYAQVPTFWKTTTMATFAQGLSPDAGEYGGPAVQVPDPSGNGPGLLGTLLKYNQIQPVGANGFSLASVWNGVKTAAKYIAPVVTAVGNILAEDGSVTKTAVQLFSSSLTGQGARNSLSRRVSYPIPEAYAKCHWVHYDPSKKEIFQRYCVASPLPDEATASLEVEITTIARFSGIAAEKQKFTYTVQRDPEDAHPPPTEDGDMEVAMTDSILPVTLTFTPYIVHHPVASIGGMDPAYLAPLTTPGLGAATITVEVPIIQIVDALTEDGNSLDFQAIALIDVECPVHIKSVIPFPETYVDAQCQPVQYGPDEAIAFGIQWMTEICVQPRYEFTEIGDAPDGDLYWHPAEIVFGLNHPGDIGFTGQHGTVLLKDYGMDYQRPYPKRAFTRRAVIGGLVETDASPPGGGITYSDLCVTVRNIIAKDNPDKA